MGAGPIGIGMPFSKSVPRRTAKVRTRWNSGSCDATCTSTRTLAADFVVDASRIPAFPKYGIPPGVVATCPAPSTVHTGSTGACTPSIQPKDASLGDHCIVTRSRLAAGKPRHNISSEATALEHKAAQTATQPAKSPRCKRLAPTLIQCWSTVTRSTSMASPCRSGASSTSSCRIITCVSQWGRVASKRNERKTVSVTLLDSLYAVTGRRRNEVSRSTWKLWICRAISLGSC